MTTLVELVGGAGLTDVEVDQLLAITAEWQVLADLSFADLVLFVHDRELDQFVAVAQMRPYTAQTIYHEDLVGERWDATQRQAVARAFVEGRIVRDGDPDWSSGVPVREEAIPVPFDGRIIGVVTREANLSMVRAPSQLELTYLQTANELSAMLASGAFPYPGEEPERELAPRVGDGLLRVDPAGVVQYASPNAISAYRRLGVVGHVLGRTLFEVDMDAEALGEALADGEPHESEVEARGAVVLRRLLPLTRDHEVLGGLLLVREITELRRHERMLQYKDATIREIHHRVKNNLQTVASLLRLQSRRLTSEEAREALGESVRRISSIALVHETLSQDSRQRVSFDKIAERLMGMLAVGLTAPDRPVAIHTHGSAGELEAEIATPLALVVSELVQNAVEHAFPDRGGSIDVTLERNGTQLTVIVADDGVGIPEGWNLEEAANLGLRIASTLVETELAGSIRVERGPEAGTRAEVQLPIPE
ncbi:MAG: two-component sensor histidine kinase [Nitriliruptoraceae bacterium]|jgi:two-component sensor histidine kinase